MEAVRQFTVGQPVDVLTHRFEDISVFNVHEGFPVQNASGGLEAFTIQAIARLLSVIGKMRCHQDIVQFKIRIDEIPGFPVQHGMQGNKVRSFQLNRYRISEWVLAAK